jgi:uncharacterized protein
VIGPEFSEDYVVMPLRRGRLDDKFLVTTDSGCWAVLDKGELELLDAHQVERDPKLFASLRASGIIATRGDFPKVKKDRKRRFWYLSNGASLQVVAVTNDCNFACKYCYSNTKSREMMSAETARKVADFIMSSPAETQVIEFSGGEPLMNFDAIKEVVLRAEKLSKKNGKKIGLSMIHNGSKWDYEKAEFFAKHGISLCFSLDGPKDLHDLHRPYRAGGGTYDDTVRWIREFHRAGYPSVRAIPVITRHSLDRGSEIVDEYLSLGIRIVRFKYIGYFGRAAPLWDELGYSPEEFLKAWKDVIEYMYQLNRRGILVVENMAQIMAYKLFRREDPGYCELQMPCGAGISQLAYAPDGSVYTCDEGRMFEEFKIGDVNMQYKDVMKSRILQKLSMASSGLTNMCNSCELKPFCGLCPLESYHMHGDLQVKVALDRRHKIHEGMLRYLISRSSREPKFQEMLKTWIRYRGDTVTFGLVSGI